jgi:hypothetical protein
MIKEASIRFGVGAGMALNWKTIKAAHVTQACEMFLNSASSQSW